MEAHLQFQYFESIKVLDIKVIEDLEAETELSKKTKTVQEKAESPPVKSLLTEVTGYSTPSLTRSAPQSAYAPPLHMSQLLFVFRRRLSIFGLFCEIPYCYIHCCVLYHPASTVKMTSAVQYKNSISIK